MAIEHVGYIELQISHGLVFIEDENGDQVCFDIKEWDDIRDAIDRMIQKSEKGAGDA